MNRKATNRRKVLTDHVRQGKLLIPPFVHHLGPMKDVSWIKTMIPELCWIALLHQAFGDRRAVELITAMCRACREVIKEKGAEGGVRTPTFASASDYLCLSLCDWAEVRARLGGNEDLEQLQNALLPLGSNYPSFPLAGLWPEGQVPEPGVDLGSLKTALTAIFERSKRRPMMVQATAIWLWFDSGKLKVFKELTLARFPEIENYPNTDLSRKVGSSIRASLNLLFDPDPPFGLRSTWPVDFWNRGLALEPCEFPNG
jgi:hypothetical protein